MVFKEIGGYELEIKRPGTMKLFGSTKKSIDKTNSEENVPSLEEVEVGLVQYHLVGS